MFVHDLLIKKLVISEDLLYISGMEERVKCPIDGHMCGRDGCLQAARRSEPHACQVGVLVFADKVTQIAEKVVYSGSPANIPQVAVDSLRLADELGVEWKPFVSAVEQNLKSREKPQ